MAEINSDKLWQWWRELASRELSLERQYKPLIDEHQKVHSKRLTVEQLISQMQDNAQPLLLAEWEQLRKGEELPILEQGPADTAFDVLAQWGAPMHYKAILEEIRKAGVVIGGRDPGTTLLAYLGRDKRFSKAPEIKRGFWKLTD